MRSVSPPQPIILEDAYPYTYSPTRHFLPLHHVISVSPLPPSSVHPAVPSLPAASLCGHATERVSYIKASSSLLISPRQRGQSWLCFRYTDPHLPTSAQKNLCSQLPLTNMPTHFPHQPNKPQCSPPLTAQLQPYSVVHMYLLRCKFKLFVYLLFSIYEMDI